MAGHGDGHPVGHGRTVAAAISCSCKLSAATWPGRWPRPPLDTLRNVGAMRTRGVRVRHGQVAGHLTASGQRAGVNYAYGHLSATLATPMSEPVEATRPAMAADRDGPALLSVSAAAKLVGCSRSTIARRVADGLMTRTPSGELHRGDVLRVGVCQDGWSVNL